MLELDYTNVLEDAVGPAGLTKEDLARAASSSPSIIERLESERMSGNLGFADLPFDDRSLAAITTFARERSFANILLLGIGGSALGPAALDEATRGQTGKRLVVLDNIDPDFIHQSLATLEPADELDRPLAREVVRPGQDERAALAVERPARRRLRR